MIRVNGFIQLDEYIDSDLLNTFVIEGYSDTDYWLIINDIEYYFKYTRRPYVELICSEIAKTLGIKSVSYDLATFRNYKGVVSKSFRNKGCRYVSGRIILKDYLCSLENINILEEMGAKRDCFLNKYLPRDINNLEIIWQAIEYRYKKLGICVDMEKIMYDLVLLLIFNILTLQNDGLPQNWELEESPNGVSLTSIFDNEYCLSFDSFDTCFSKLTTNLKDHNQSNYQILEEFLNISDSKFIILFLDKFNIITEERFLQIIKKVEEHIECEIPLDIKNDYIIAFNENRKKIKSVLENKGINSENIKDVVNSLE